MNEKTLLWIALVGGIIGIVFIALSKPLPPQTLSGTVAWTNGTHGWLETCQDVWVESTHEALIRDQHVNITGYYSGQQFIGRPFRVDQ